MLATVTWPKCWARVRQGDRPAAAATAPTCFLPDDGPVLEAVDVFLQPRAELHVAHIVQKDVDDGPCPAAHLGGRQDLTELKESTHQCWDTPDPGHPLSKLTLQVGN